jgi:NAD(P)-dependent dehydrogenase (short-subunit alcohol dehydrogenase family)
VGVNTITLQHIHHRHSIWSDSSTIMSATRLQDFDLRRDVPSLASKVVVITGGKWPSSSADESVYVVANVYHQGTGWLGRETVTSLIRNGAPRIFFTGRNADCATQTIQAARRIRPECQIEFVQCDHADLRSVKLAGLRIAAATERIDIVFANAVLLASPPGQSKDGFGKWRKLSSSPVRTRDRDKSCLSPEIWKTRADECLVATEIQFATNHLGHAMLVRQLLPTLLRTAAQPGSDVRMIFNSSPGYLSADRIEYETINSQQVIGILGGFKRFGQSKLANILYPAELARRFPAITSVSVNPGIVRPNKISSLAAYNEYCSEPIALGHRVTNEEGVKNQIWAATVDKSLIQNGAFYEMLGRPNRTSDAARSETFAAELFVWTERVLARF